MRPIVADAGPLIALSRIRRLAVLPRLFAEVAVPAVVLNELRLDERRPGVEDLARAVAAKGWLQSRTPREGSRIAGLDEGESAAIHLAGQLRCPLLVDERRGRVCATRRGIPVVGTGRILIEAKRRGLIAKVADELAALQAAGYRLADPLCREILALAGEDGA
jgi:predicted nucleic acid-binding protein